MRKVGQVLSVRPKIEKLEDLQELQKDNHNHFPKIH
jgi:hypothetical protein